LGVTPNSFFVAKGKASEIPALHERMSAGTNDPCLLLLSAVPIDIFAHAKQFTVYTLASN
jgi:hypothetical protein